MNENSPLPQPSGATCPNCGAAQKSEDSFCTNCGAPLRIAAPNSLSTTSKIIISVALAFGALTFGALGACFTLISGGEGFSSGFALFIIVPFVIALACIWGIFRVQKK